MSFLLRWVFAFLLVGATWNPTPWNYLSWARRAWEPQLPPAVLLGLLLFVTYVIYLRATMRSIGRFGMGLVLAIVAALLWVLYDYGLIDLADPELSAWIGISALSLVLGIGLSWSTVRRRISGQVDMDDVDG